MLEVAADKILVQV